MSYIWYHKENGNSPWVCHIKSSYGGHLWFAYPTFWKVVCKFPELWIGLRVAYCRKCSAEGQKLLEDCPQKIEKALDEKKQNS